MRRTSRGVALAGILGVAGFGRFASAVDPGTITAFAGSGRSGYQGDGSPARGPS